MAKIMDKVLGFMGFEEEEVEILEEEESAINEDDAGKRKKNGTLFSLHSQKNIRVVVCEPKVFEDCQTIADNLKNRRPVIVNLEEADKDLAKRVVDFVSGCTYALNGGTQKVGNGIFLFVPSNMDIAAENREAEKEREKEKEKGLFTWVR
ncbi:MAG: cell division protein SepF [Thermincola sp.]|nr:cell division protein SepF [Thermincola sp.]MDT3704071.1 cell division protein SepF [Thermincola sp.]